MAQEKPADPQTRAEIENALLVMRQKAVEGDVPGLMEHLYASPPGGEQLREPTARLFVALEAVKSAVRKRLKEGEDLDEEPQPGFASVAAIRSASVFVEGNHAELRFAPQHQGPADAYHLDKIDGRWKLNLARINLEKDADLAGAAKLALVFAAGLEDILAKIEADDIPEGSHPVEFATSHAMSFGMSLKEADLPALQQRLVTLQRERHPQRKAAARQEATRPATQPAR